MVFQIRAKVSRDPIENGPVNTAIYESEQVSLVFNFRFFLRDIDTPNFHLIGVRIFLPLHFATSSLLLLSFHACNFRLVRFKYPKSFLYYANLRQIHTRNFLPFHINIQKYSYTISISKSSP